MDKKYLEFEKPLETIEKEIERLLHQKKSHFVDTQKEIVELQQKAVEKTREIFAGLSPIQKVHLARHPNRPHTADYIEALFTDFVELHGDRIVADDSAIIAGIAKFRGRPVAVVGQQKGRDTKENLERKFGMAHPEGYRKALRVMKLAEKFLFPVVTFIDTPGANPDMQAEERGQALFIAANLMEMAMLQTPIVCIVIGEGGSGGALGIGVGDRILIQEYAVYSVISPEGCASILWKNQQAVADAAKALKLTAEELYALKVVDGVIPEPAGGAHRNREGATALVGDALARYIEELRALPVQDLIDARHQKYRSIGFFTEKEPESHA